MILLRRVIGDALRARRQAQHRTLREVSTAANVSLGYLSEIERGQKEASSELLASICDALGARMSEVLGDVSQTLALGERVDGLLVPAGGVPMTTRAGQDHLSAGGAVATAVVARETAPAAEKIALDPVSKGETAPDKIAAAAITSETVTVDGEVSVRVRHESPLRTTLRATRRDRGVSRRDLTYVS